MKVNIKPEIIEWISDSSWHTEYEGKTGEERRRLIEEDIEEILQAHINKVERARDE